jgi:hypothetical protein
MLATTLSSEAIPYECALGGTPCDPANDQASVPGQRGNSDCVPTGAFNICGRAFDIPTSDDCAPGGLCDNLDGGTGTKNEQCEDNGFCVISSLPLPLLGQDVEVTPDAGGGPIYLGWFDDPAVCPDPAGSACTLPPTVFANPTGPIGLRINASGLILALECNMAVDDGTGTGAATSADADLLEITAQPPGSDCQ